MDKRKKGICRHCGGAVERPTITAAWSHVSPLAERLAQGGHVAEPYPKQERNQ